MTSDASRLLAEGSSVPLANGQAARLRYGMKSILLLEQRFGSLASIQRALEEVKDKGTEGPMLRTLCNLVMPGLVDEGYGLDDVDVLDLGHLADYFAAVNTELARAFPASDPQPAQVKKTTRKRSPGPSSITQLPSGSDEARANSGA